ncbi:S1C family serine protease [Halorussus gelatinilyticus]|uniref:S1C family serine protease n=1 Tax=Halorussus gelatinilyticus TaxID=2937524 RepID=A0A8U0ING3_9EURY|nr:trypsin-like peptidase domain-containing protein [Halorussus gelatinilyticus]UPW01992.1 S1C family serine protease [Halorussus gelatinilyticus]
MVVGGGGHGNENDSTAWSSTARRGAGRGGAGRAAVDATDAPAPDARPTEPQATGAAAAQANDCNYTALYRQTESAVVAVNSSNASGNLGEGSGWVYRLSNGVAYLVTNWHVVANATDYDVQFNRGRWREAELVGADFWTDLAVLRVSDPPASATALDVADGSVRRGQPIAVLGNALGYEESISPGVVTGTDRAVSVFVRPGLNLTIPGTLQTDASAPFGSSGGPWVNCDGEVVAVMHAGTLPFDVSFGIPGALVRHVVPTLADGRNVTHPLLGARTVDLGPELAEANNLSVSRGAYVVDVPPWGPAAGELEGSPAIHRRTWLPYGGDVILSIEGTPVLDNEDLQSYLLLETRPNETVTMTVRRDGENETVSVTLGERPQVPPWPGLNATVPDETTTGANETTTAAANRDATPGTTG